MAPSSSSSVAVLDLPVGYIFQPTDEELLGYYLYNKICGTPCKYDVVKEVDLYGNTEPWDIWNEFDGPKLAKNQDLYFFTKLTKVSDKGSRVARKAGSKSGTWKGENSGTQVYYHIDAKKKKHLLGLWKRFHYENNEPDHRHESWIMHEYSLDESLMPKSTNSDDHRYVLCRIRRIVRKRKLLVAAASALQQSQNKIQRLAALPIENNIGESNIDNGGLIMSVVVDQVIDQNIVTEPPTGGFISHQSHEPPADQGGLISNTQQPELDYSIQNDIDDDDFLIDLSSIWDSDSMMIGTYDDHESHTHTHQETVGQLTDEQYYSAAANEETSMKAYDDDHDHHESHTHQLLSTEETGQQLIIGEQSTAANEEMMMMMMMMRTLDHEHDESHTHTHQETGQLTDEHYSAANEEVLMIAYDDDHDHHESHTHQLLSTTAANEEMMMMMRALDHEHDESHSTHTQLQPTPDDYSDFIQLTDIGFGVTEQMGPQFGIENNNAHINQFDYYGAMQPSFTTQDDQQYSSYACLPQSSYDQYQEEDDAMCCPLPLWT